MTDLRLSDEQQALRDAARAMFAREATIERVRKAEPHGFDAELWSTLSQSGWATLGVPEAKGGASAGAIDLVLLAQEYGRALAPVPLVEAIVAADLLAAAGATDLLAAVVDGAVLPTIAVRPASDGRARLVPAGTVAEVAVVLRDDDLLAVRRPTGPRPYLPAIPNLGNLPLADWQIDAPDGDVQVLAHGDRAHQLHRRAVSEWKLLTAAALEGLRERALRIGVDYVKERHAFGVALGWFQAVQHRLADDAAAGEAARLLVLEAAWARDSGNADADVLATMAFLAEADAAFQTCRTSLQFHGGYGYTLEYDIQLFFRRAKSWPLVGGPLTDGYRELADELFVAAQEG